MTGCLSGVWGASSYKRIIRIMPVFKPNDIVGSRRTVVHDLARLRTFPSATIQYNS